MDVSNSGSALVPNSDQSLSSNEIQWIIISKRDGKSKLLPRGMIFVGREECDIILSSTTVDKRHAVIFFNTTNEQFHVKDLNSSYGTYVNEKRIPDQCYLKLEHLDRLRFGFGPDVFIIEKISCLSFTSSKSNISSPQMTNSANSNTTSILDHSEDSNEEEENLLMKSVNHQNVKNNKSESIVSQNEAQTHFSEEQTSTPLSTTPTNQNITTSPSTHITSNDVSQTVLPPTQLISSLNENYENNSSSSLSTVDSLDEIKPSKRVVNNKILSPVRESNEVTNNNSRDLCSNESIKISQKDCFKKQKNWQIVNNKNGLNESESATSASASCTPTSGSSSMAFIIPFDSDDKSFKKKLNIKDSIRQFAPPKPDSIEKPRPQKTTNNDLNKSNNLFGSQKSPTMQSKQKKNIRSTPLTNRNSFNGINETNGHLSDSATYLIHRMLCSENQNTIPVKNMIESSNMRRNSSDLSSKSTPTKEKCSPTNSGEKDSGVSDDNKSETGTYTVELDPKDNDLEDARKKIDEIFGVFDDSNAFSVHSSPEILSPELVVNSAQNFMLSHEKSAPNNNLFTNQSFSSPKFSRKFITNEEISGLPQNLKPMPNASTFTRPKRKLPTPPNLLVRNELKSDNEIRNKSNVLKDSPVLYSNDLSNKMKNSSEMKSSRNENGLSTCYNTSQNHDLFSSNNSTGNSKPKPVSNSHSAPATPRSPLVSRKILQLKDNSKTLINNRRKNSWNNSNSDLDHYESYNSDESTDQSQRSSNSALSKDGGNISCASVPSKMRFNRAFALRRARLGIETPGIPVDMNKNKNKINSNTKQEQQKSSFSRNDGGRFSLRLPKNDSNDNSRKHFNQNNSINRIGSQEKVNKPSLQRKISDPMSNKAVNGNRSALKSTLSDNDRSVNNRVNSPWIQSLRQNNNKNNSSNNHNNNCLQKSASFADSNVFDSNRNSDNNSSVRSIPTFQMGKRFFSTKPHQMAQIENSIRAKNSVQKPDIMSISMTEGSHKSPESPTYSVGKSSPQHQNKSTRELSALDSLVVSAVNQLSNKLRTNMRTLLERERVKHSKGSETRVLIDEILPQVSSPDRRLNDNNDSNISRDLSNILKNLKKVEQSFDVVSMLLDPNAITSLSSRRTSNGFFVDV